MDFTFKDKYDINDFLKITAILRGEGGCPWDREQTYQSLKKYVLEEAHEVIDACDVGGMKLADELGDLLLQITMLSQLGTEDKTFSFDDVCDLVSKKMILRHPHVFGDIKADTSEKVLDNWEKIKKQERDIATVTDSMKDITKALPSLVRAYKIQSKASKVGFDWDNVNPCIDKVKEEIEEVSQAIEKGNREEIEKEIGDLLFSVVNVARFQDVNPELAAEKSNKKFINRFEYVENEVAKMGKKMGDMTLSELDKLWDEAKTIEAQL
ncbi:MAG: nucleoside triphosphate pyrophosphohydrolase [Clostridia bacterium]|nr:nucleoside triphosphate pyrophosphohydrolase [Clostridia bacterium]